MSERRGRLSTPRAIALFVGLAVWSAVYIWPLWSILHRSLVGVAGNAGLSGATFRSVLSDPRLGRLAVIGIAQTVVSTAVVLLIGVPIGWVIGRLKFRGRDLLQSILMTPFVLPTLSIAMAMAALVNGVPDALSARFALIIAAHVVFNVGIVVRAVAVAVSATSPSFEEAAASLGRGHIARIAATTLSSIRGVIGSAAIVVSIFCFTSFGVIVALGGPRLGTLEVEVWYLTTRSLDLATASVLVLGQLLVVLVLVIVYQRGRTSHVGGVPFARRPPSSRFETSAIWAAWLTGVMTAGSPLVALMLRSLRSSDEWTIANYSALPLDSVWRTITWALVAMVISFVIAVPMVVAASRIDAVGRICEGAMMVPFAMSAATLGLGFLLGFGGDLIDLRGSWFMVPAVQAAGAAPVVVRILISATRSLDPKLSDAAALSGAGPLRRAVEVVWPQIRRTVVVALGVAFAMSVGEFGATVFLSRSDSPTVSVLIGRLLGRPGAANAGQALALSVVLAFIAGASVMLADWGDGTDRV